MCIRYQDQERIMKVAKILSATAVALAIIGGVAMAGNGAGRFGYFAPDVTTLAAEFGNPGERLQVVPNVQDAFYQCLGV